ncbi:dTDP-4-dehydrorhamnose 3,5-epimerase [Halocola ammonii]
MKIEKTAIRDVLIIEPRVFADERGYFFESFNRKTFVEKTGMDIDFVQDNESMSGAHVLRGLHFQEPPHAQDKLVRVVQGSVLDVVVDLRQGSPTYGKFEKCLLSAENKRQFFVPKGMAHGFLTLEPNTIFSYKCSDYYHPETENGIAWNDPEIGIDWEVEKPLLSEKDQQAMSLSKFRSPFRY